MTIPDVNHNRRAGAQAALSPCAAVPVPTRRPFQFAYVGDAELARECFARSRSVEIIDAAPGSNITLDRLPIDARSGEPLSPDILFIEHGYPGVDTHAILRDIAARHKSLHVVIVASWDEEFAKQSFTLGAADYVTKSNASLRAVAFRMGRLMAQAAHLKAQQQALDADTTTVDVLEREVAATTLALRRAEAQHASERAEAAEQLAATKRQAETRQAAMDAAAERQATFETDLTAEVARREALAAELSDLRSALAQATERHRSEMAAAVARVADLQQQADADGQTAAEAALQREAEFDTRLAAEVDERHLLAKKLASAVAALQQAEQQRASENSEAAALLAATKRQARPRRQRTTSGDGRCGPAPGGIRNAIDGWSRTPRGTRDAVVGSPIGVVAGGGASPIRNRRCGRALRGSGAAG